MKRLQSFREPALILLAIAVLGAFTWAAATQGPLAPVKVSVTQAKIDTLTPSVFGIGVVEARRSYNLGPTVASRVSSVLVDHGDVVEASQVLAEMDPVDMEERMLSSRLAAERAVDAVQAAQAQLNEARSRYELAELNVKRYTDLRAQGFVTQAELDAKRYEANAAKAAIESATALLSAARRDEDRAQADAAGIAKIRAQATLTSPVNGIVTARLVEPGTTIVAGQAVLQIIDPQSLWVKTRIDQAQAGHVAIGQAATIVLRSRPHAPLAGKVAQIELISDPVTEEQIINVAFADTVDRVPVGELAEVTLHQPPIPDVLTAPSAAIHYRNGTPGVWRLNGDRVSFQAVKLGLSTLDGHTRILEGLNQGDTFVVHSWQTLDADTRVKVVPQLLQDKTT